jgi:hypothetical protein
MGDRYKYITLAVSVSEHWEDWEFVAKDSGDLRHCDLQTTK